MHSIIEFDLATCSIRRCYLEETANQYTVFCPQCLVIKIKGDYRDMTEQGLKKRCLMEIRNVVDFHLNTL